MDYWDYDNYLACYYHDKIDLDLRNMEIKKILWIVIVLLLIAAAYLVFIKGGASGNVVAAGAQAGEQVVSQAGSEMVGGC